MNIEVKLEEKRQEIIESCKNVLSEQLSVCDYFFAGAANRSLALLDGFITLHHNQNYLCIAPIVRMHLDTVFRLFASTIVLDVPDFVKKVMNGDSLGKIEDVNGNKMRDFYLKKEFMKFWTEQDVDVSWVDRVYEKTSGHIHFSKVHTYSAMESLEDMGASLNFCIDGRIQHYCHVIDEACEAMCEITDIICFYLNHWAESKS